MCVCVYMYVFMQFAGIARCPTPTAAAPRIASSFRTPARISHPSRPRPAPQIIAKPWLNAICVAHRTHVQYVEPLSTPYQPLYIYIYIYGAIYEAVYKDVYMTIYFNMHLKPNSLPSRKFSTGQNMHPYIKKGHAQPHLN